MTIVIWLRNGRTVTIGHYPEIDGPLGSFVYRVVGGERVRRVLRVA